MKCRKMLICFLLISVIAGSIPHAKADQADTARSLSIVAYKYYQNLYGDIDFNWTEDRLKQLSGSLYLLDEISPLTDRSLVLIASQVYDTDDEGSISKAEAIELVREYAVENLLVPKKEKLREYAVALRLFDETYAPRYIKVSIIREDGRIICAEIDAQRGHMEGIRLLDEDEHQLTPFILDKHFLKSADGLSKWNDDSAPEEFWIKMKHILSRCADVPEMIKAWKKEYGNDSRAWAVERQAVEHIWNDIDFDGICGIPSLGDITQQAAVSIAQSVYYEKAQDIFPLEVRARFVALCEFKHRYAGLSVWIVWFVDPADGGECSNGLVMVDAHTGQVMEIIVGRGQG